MFPDKDVSEVSGNTISPRMMCGCSRNFVSKGQIILPAPIRQQDGIEPGQEFDIERIENGPNLLKRTTRPRNEGLVQLLLSCPVKGWFQPADRKETTDDVAVPRLA